MGLLDDAIREHLELKRLRGADLGEVAREERDALGPVRREIEGLRENPHESETGGLPSDAPPSTAVSDAQGEPSIERAGQETVEINMEGELKMGGDPGRESRERAGGQATPIGHPAHTRAGEDESLEWEVPGESQSVQQVAGDDPEDPLIGEDTKQGEHIEDVLEETPDFLRDTPEQERLWFEQRPPRDFDFNE